MDKEQNQPSLAKQSLWILLAKVFGFALSVLLPLLIVRRLSQDSVGVYRQAFLIIVTATSILPFGFSMSAYYFLNRAPEQRSSTILNILLFNFLAGGFAFLALCSYPAMLGSLFQDAEMHRLAPAIGLAIWVAIFSAFLETAALANQEAKLATAFIILAQLTKALLMGGAVIIFASADAIVYAAIIQGIGQTVILVLYLNSRFPRFWRSFDRAFFREHLVYALPFGFAAVLYNAQADLHNYFVAYRFSSAEYAIYVYGCFQLPLIWALYESVSAVLLSRMSELQALGEKRQMLLTSFGAMQKLALAYFPLCVFLLIVSEQFITTLFTQSFAASVPIFRINLLLLPLYCLILDPIERSFKELGLFLTKVRTGIVLALALSLYYGIWNLGLTGIISIVVLAVFCERIISLWKVLQLLEARRSDISLLKNIGLAAAAALLAGTGLFAFNMAAKEMLLHGCIEFSRWILSEVGFTQGEQFFGGVFFLGICGLFFAPLYLFFVHIFGVLEPHDRARILSAAGRLKNRVRIIEEKLFNSRRTIKSAENEI